MPVHEHKGEAVLRKHLARQKAYALGRRLILPPLTSRQADDVLEYLASLKARIAELTEALKRIKAVPAHAKNKYSGDWRRKAIREMVFAARSVLSQSVEGQ